MNNALERQQLALQIEQFISEKRAFGYRYVNEEKRLENFYRFTINSQCKSYLSKATIMSWVDEAVGTANRNMRSTIMRQFALFLNRNAQTAYVIPTAFRSIERSSFEPYIFSRQEILRIFNTADKHGSFGRIPHSSLSFPLIIRILYCCGLRISEALSLKLEAINFRKGVLTIRDTKFFKDRLIPMHENLTKLCVEYAQIVHVFSPTDSLFFPSGNGGRRIENSAFYHHFKKLLLDSNVCKTDSKQRFRVHDMRHTFAVHCLQKLDREGLDMNAVLPILATYMGHTSYVGTGTYLHLTAELYPEIAEKVDNVYGDLLPSGGTYEN